MAIVGNIQLQNGSVTPPKLDETLDYWVAGLTASCRIGLGNRVYDDTSFTGFFTYKTSCDLEATFATTKADGNASIYLNNDSNVNWAMKVSGTANDAWMLQTASGDTVERYTALAVNPDGLMSIGSSAVDSTSILSLNVSDSSSGGLRLNNSTDNIVLDLRVTSSSGEIGTSSNNQLGLKTNNVTHMCIKTDGTVCIPNLVATIEPGSSGSVQWQSSGSNIYFDCGNVSIGTNNSLAPFHVWQGDSGQGTAHTHAGIVLEDSGENSINILSGNSNYGGIVFGDDGDNDIGFIQYKHGDNFLRIGTNTSVALCVDSSQNIIGNANICAAQCLCAVGQLCTDQGANLGGGLITDAYLCAGTFIRSIGGSICSDQCLCSVGCTIVGGRLGVGINAPLAPAHIVTTGTSCDECGNIALILCSQAGCRNATLLFSDGNEDASISHRAGCLFFTTDSAGIVLVLDEICGVTVVCQELCVKCDITAVTNICAGQCLCSVGSIFSGNNIIVAGSFYACCLKSATGCELGGMYSRGCDTCGNLTDFARIYGCVGSGTNAAECGLMKINLVHAGTNRDVVAIDVGALTYCCGGFRTRNLIPTAGTVVGCVCFQGCDSCGNVHTYGNMFTCITSGTSGAECGYTQIQTLTAGTLNTTVHIAQYGICVRCAVCASTYIRSGTQICASGDICAVTNLCVGGLACVAGVIKSPSTICSANSFCSGGSVIAAGLIDSNTNICADQCICAVGCVTVGGAVVAAGGCFSGNVFTDACFCLCAASGLPGYVLFGTENGGAKYGCHWIGTDNNASDSCLLDIIFGARCNSGTACTIETARITAKGILCTSNFICSASTIRGTCILTAGCICAGCQICAAQGIRAGATLCAVGDTTIGGDLCVIGTIYGVTTGVEIECSNLTFTCPKSATATGIGCIIWQACDTCDNTQDYGHIFTCVTNGSCGQECGLTYIKVAVGGTLTNIASFNSTSGDPILQAHGIMSATCNICSSQCVCAVGCIVAGGLICSADLIKAGAGICSVTSIRAVTNICTDQCLCAVGALCVGGQAIVKSSIWAEDGIVTTSCTASAAGIVAGQFRLCACDSAGAGQAYGLIYSCIQSGADNCECGRMVIQVVGGGTLNDAIYINDNAGVIRVCTTGQFCATGWIGSTGQICAVTNICAGGMIGSGACICSGTCIRSTTSTVAGTFMSAGACILAATCVCAGTCVRAQNQIIAGTTVTSGTYIYSGTYLASDEGALFLCCDNAAASDDIVGCITFTGEDACGNNQTYSYIRTCIQGATCNNENGRIIFSVVCAGGNVDKLNIGGVAVCAAGLCSTGIICSGGSIVSGGNLCTPSCLCTALKLYVGGDALVTGCVCATAQFNTAGGIWVGTCACVAAAVYADRVCACLCLCSVGDTCVGGDLNVVGTITGTINPASTLIVTQLCSCECICALGCIETGANIIINNASSVPRVAINDASSSFTGGRAGEISFQSCDSDLSFLELARISVCSNCITSCTDAETCILFDVRCDGTPVIIQRAYLSFDAFEHCGKVCAGGNICGAANMCLTGYASITSYLRAGSFGANGRGICLCCQNIYSYHNCPVAGQVSGQYIFSGCDDAGNSATYGMICVCISEPANTCECGCMVLGVATAGAIDRKLDIAPFGTRTCGIHCITGALMGYTGNFTVSACTFCIEGKDIALTNLCSVASQGATSIRFCACDAGSAALSTALIQSCVMAGTAGAECGVFNVFVSVGGSATKRLQISEGLICAVNACITTPAYVRASTHICATQCLCAAGAVCTGGKVCAGGSVYAASICSPNGVINTGCNVCAGENICAVQCTVAGAAAIGVGGVVSCENIFMICQVDTVGTNLGNLYWQGCDSGGAVHEYGSIYTCISNGTAGTECGCMHIQVVIAGTATTVLSVFPGGAKVRCDLCVTSNIYGNGFICNTGNICSGGEIHSACVCSSTIIRSAGQYFAGACICSATCLMAAQDVIAGSAIFAAACICSATTMQAQGGFTTASYVCSALAAGTTRSCFAGCVTISLLDVATNICTGSLLRTGGYVCAAGSICSGTCLCSVGDTCVGGDLGVVGSFSASQFDVTNSNFTFICDQSAAGTGIGCLTWNACDDCGNDRDYARLMGCVSSGACGVECGKFLFQVMSAGTLTTKMCVDHQGVIFTGYLCAGCGATINGGQLYVDCRVFAGNSGFVTNCAQACAGCVAGGLCMKSCNDAAFGETYVCIFACNSNPAASCECGAFLVNTLDAGTLTTHMRVNASGVCSDHFCSTCLEVSLCAWIECIGACCISSQNFVVHCTFSALGDIVATDRLQGCRLCLSGCGNVTSSPEFSWLTGCMTSCDDWLSFCIDCSINGVRWCAPAYCYLGGDMVIANDLCVVNDMCVKGNLNAGSLCGGNVIENQALCLVCYCANAAGEKVQEILFFGCNDCGCAQQYARIEVCIMCAECGCEGSNMRIFNWCNGACACALTICCDNITSFLTICTKESLCSEDCVWAGKLVQAGSCMLVCCSAWICGCLCICNCLEVAKDITVQTNMCVVGDIEIGGTATGSFPSTAVTGCCYVCLEAGNVKLGRDGCSTGVQGCLTFCGCDTAGNGQRYGYIRVDSTNTTSGDECGSMTFLHAHNANLCCRLVIEPNRVTTLGCFYSCGNICSSCSLCICCDATICNNVSVGGTITAAGIICSAVNICSNQCLFATLDICTVANVIADQCVCAVGCVRAGEMIIGNAACAICGVGGACICASICIRTPYCVVAGVDLCSQQCTVVGCALCVMNKACVAGGVDASKVCSGNALEVFNGGASIYGSICSRCGTIATCTTLSAVGTSLEGFTWKGRNDCSQNLSYSCMGSCIVDDTCGSEDSQITFRIMCNGTLAERLKIYCTGICICSGVVIAAGSICTTQCLCAVGCIISGTYICSAGNISATGCLCAQGFINAGTDLCSQRHVISKCNVCATNILCSGSDACVGGDLNVVGTINGTLGSAAASSFCGCWFTAKNDGAGVSAGTIIGCYDFFSEDNSCGGACLVMASIRSCASDGTYDGTAGGGSGHLMFYTRNCGGAAANCDLCERVSIDRTGVVCIACRSCIRGPLNVANCITVTCQICVVGVVCGVENICSAKCLCAVGNLNTLKWVMNCASGFPCGGIYWCNDTLCRACVLINSNDGCGSSGYSMTRIILGACKTTTSASIFLQTSGPNCNSCTYTTSFQVNHEGGGYTQYSLCAAQCVCAVGCVQAGNDVRAAGDLCTPQCLVIGSCASVGCHVITTAGNVCATGNLCATGFVTAADYVCTVAGYFTTGQNFCVMCLNFEGLGLTYNNCTAAAGAMCLAFFGKDCSGNGATLGNISYCTKANCCNAICAAMLIRVNCAGSNGTSLAICGGGICVAQNICSAGGYLTLAGTSPGVAGKANIYLRRVDTAMVGSDNIGCILFTGDDASTTNVPGAVIKGCVGGTWASGDTPGVLIFQTTPAGSETPADRVWIMSNGTVCTLCNLCSDGQIHADCICSSTIIRSAGQYFAGSCICSATCIIANACIQANARVNAPNICASQCITATCHIWTDANVCAGQCLCAVGDVCAGGSVCAAGAVVGDSYISSPTIRAICSVKAAGDETGTINLAACDSGDAQQCYGVIFGCIQSPTAGAECGAIFFQVADAGTLTTKFSIREGVVQSNVCLCIAGTYAKATNGFCAHSNQCYASIGPGFITLSNFCECAGAGATCIAFCACDECGNGAVFGRIIHCVQNGGCNVECTAILFDVMDAGSIARILCVHRSGIKVNKNIASYCGGNAASCAGSYVTMGACDDGGNPTDYSYIRSCIQNPAAGGESGVTIIGSLCSGSNSDTARFQYNCVVLLKKSCASAALDTTVLCATSCVRVPNVCSTVTCGTTCVASPVICAGTCVRGQALCSSSFLCAATNVCAVQCVVAGAEICAGTVSRAASFYATDCICSPGFISLGGYVNAAGSICAGLCLCAGGCVQAPFISGACGCFADAKASGTLCANQCVKAGADLCSVANAYVGGDLYVCSDSTPLVRVGFEGVTESGQIIIDNICGSIFRYRIGAASVWGIAACCACNAGATLMVCDGVGGLVACFTCAGDFGVNRCIIAGTMVCSAGGVCAASHIATSGGDLYADQCVRALACICSATCVNALCKVVAGAALMQSCCDATNLCTHDTYPLIVCYSHCCIQSDGTLYNAIYHHCYVHQSRNNQTGACYNCAVADVRVCVHDHVCCPNLCCNAYATYNIFLLNQSCTELEQVGRFDSSGVYSERCVRAAGCICAGGKLFTSDSICTNTNWVYAGGVCTTDDVCAGDMVRAAGMVCAAGVICTGVQICAGGMIRTASVMCAALAVCSGTALCAPDLCITDDAFFGDNIRSSGGYVRQCNNYFEARCYTSGAGTKGRLEISACNTAGVAMDVAWIAFCATSSLSACNEYGEINFHHIDGGCAMDRRVSISNNGLYVYSYGSSCQCLGVKAGVCSKSGYLELHCCGTIRIHLDGQAGTGCFCGDVCAGGDVNAPTKSFMIQHPCANKETPNKFNSMTLRHAVAEGPEYNVFYRGTANLCCGEAEIELPEYFEALTAEEDRTIQLTPVGGWSPLVVKCRVCNGIFIVCTTQDGVQDQEFDWRVDARRNDHDIRVNMKNRGITDTDGKLIPERWADRPTHLNRNEVEILEEDDLKDILRQHKRAILGTERKSELVERALYYDESKEETTWQR